MGELTLSMTFSSELGQSMAKQTKSMSVSGYESGRRRSYSSWPAVSQSSSSTVLPEGVCVTGAVQFSKTVGTYFWLFVSR